MLFSINQIQELLFIIEKNTNIFIAKNIGSDYLTNDEIKKLVKVGINPKNLYNKNSDIIRQSFYFGLISDSLGGDSNKINFNELKSHFSSGKHIPLTKVEEHSIDSIKKQFLGDIKANQGRIFNDVNGIISSKEKDNREAYENAIREEIKRGIVDRKTTSEIARELGRKTGDWSRNFTRIVEYQSHQALTEGRLSFIEKQGGKRLYVDVYAGACKHCVKLFLTNGVGSRPKIFTLKEWKSYGTNVGKKVNEWKPCIPCHPFCRCNIVLFKEGSVWNKETKRFESGKKINIEGRKPIKFTIKFDDGRIKDYFV